MHRKQVVTVLGSLAALVAVLVLAVPRSVQAVVAAAVQVMNTSANPVPTYNGGVRFEADVCFASGSTSTASGFCSGINSGNFQVPTTTSTGAAVKHLLVDNVSGLCSSFNNPANFIKAVRLLGNIIPDAVSNGQAQFSHYVPIVGPAYSYTNASGTGVLSNVPETDYSYGQTTHFTFNPGDTVTLEAYSFSPGNGSIDEACVAKVEGELVLQ